MLTGIMSPIISSSSIIEPTRWETDLLFVLNIIAYTNKYNTVPARIVPALKYNPHLVAAPQIENEENSSLW